MNFEEKATMDIMQIKSNFQRMPFVPFETFELMLSMYMSQIKRVKELEKQLDYALENGGQYLQINDMIQ